AMIVSCVLCPLPFILWFFHAFPIRSHAAAGGGRDAAGRARVGPGGTVAAIGGRPARATGPDAGAGDGPRRRLTLAGGAGQIPRGLPRTAQGVQADPADARTGVRRSGVRADEQPAT